MNQGSKKTPTCRTRILINALKFCYKGSYKEIDKQGM